MELTDIAMLFFVMGFVVCYSSESFTLITRLAFKAIDKESLGMFYITVVMLGTRVGASLYFPAGAFMVDTGSTPKEISLIFIISLLFISALLILMSLYSEKVINYFRVRENLSIVERGTQSKALKLNILYSVPIFFNSLAVIIPLCVATQFPSYRATIVQLGFIINSVGTVLNVFLIEKYIAKSLQNSLSDGEEAIQRVLLSRALGLFLVIFLVLSMLYFLD